MGGFNNPVVGALNLIRRAIRSPDFQAGVAGWSINQDGSAEFNNVTTRGPVDVVGDDGSFVFIHTEAGGNAGITMQPPSTPGANYRPGSIATESDGISKETDLVITSPCETSGAALTAQIVMEGSDGTRPNPLIVLNATDVSVPGNLAVDGNLSVNGTVIATGDLTAAADATVLGDADILGILSAGNIAVGSVAITPVPGTPTTVTVNYGPLTGVTFIGLATANTTVPGTVVTGVGISSVTNTSARVTVTRTNNTPTGVFWLIFGV